MSKLIFVAGGIAVLGLLYELPEARAQVERRERDYVPETFTHRHPPATKRPSPKAANPQPKPEQPKAAWTPAPPRDPDLAQCDDFRRRFEQAIRQEGRGGSAAELERLTQERQGIYRAQLRAGCI